MNLLQSWLLSPMAEAMAKTLLHSLWQGAVVALVLAIVLSVARSSRIRYAATCLAMIALFAALMVTLGRQMPEKPVHIEIAGGRHFPVTNPIGGQLSTGPLNVEPSGQLAWLVPFWITGVLFFHARALAGWMAARRLRRTGVCHAPDPWRARLNGLSARLGMDRSVILLESCLAEVPVVMGVLRPAILMPVGLLAGLPAAQVEAILLHELAHIRRYDYLVNLLQAFAEGLLFYHPAVWWISRMMRTERENCCDDLVVSVTGGVLVYVTALTELESRRGNAGAMPALAATDGGLMRRVRRLLGQQDRRYVPAMPALTAALLTVIVATAVMALQFSSGRSSAIETPVLPAARSLPVPIPVIPFTRPAGGTRLLAQAQTPQTPPPAATTGTMQPDKVLYDRAIVDIGRRNYVAARLTLNTLLNNYPSSEYQLKAKLAVADSWYREGGDHGKAQAEAEYKDFIQFYPGTPEAKDVQLKLLAMQPPTPYRKWADGDPTAYDLWLTQDVVYIISDEERFAFTRLTTDEEREKFVEQFWARRDPTPGTPDNEFKQEHYRRIAYANAHFADSLPGWRTDRGRIYIQYGPPDEIEAHSAGGAYQRPAAQGGGETETYPFEQWRYRLIDGVGQNIIIEFVDRSMKGEYKMTMDPSEKDALRNVVTPRR